MNNPQRIEHEARRIRQLRGEKRKIDAVVGELLKKAAKTDPVGAYSVAWLCSTLLFWCQKHSEGSQAPLAA